MDGGSIERMLREHTGDIVLCVDAAGKITFWNDGAERLLGFPRSEALGASLDLIVPAHLRDRHWAGFNNVIGSGTSPSPAWVRTPVLHADGTTTRMAITVVLLKDAERSSGMMAILSPL
jgi:PAS domain S-box-containing protein